MISNEKVIEANIQLHSHLSDKYNSCEPHFRPENISKVREKIEELTKKSGTKNLLDLGCGTGFIISIAKEFFENITGADVTEAMLNQVDLSGNCNITLIKEDTGQLSVERNTFDLVTAYSFLHHLYDIKPTLTQAYEALRPEGIFYADLDPNFYFWDEISKLERDGNYDPIVKREIEMTTFKDEDIEQSFGIDKDTFNQAEYGKNIKGGFKEETVVKTLSDIGFKDIEFNYHWFLGEGHLINDESYEKDYRFELASVCNNMLQKNLPLSRHLFKYVSVTATK